MQGQSIWCFLNQVFSMNFETYSNYIAYNNLRGEIR